MNVEENNCSVHPQALFSLVLATMVVLAWETMRGFTSMVTTLALITTMTIMGIILYMGLCQLLGARFKCSKGLRLADLCDSRLEGIVKAFCPHIRSFVAQRCAERWRELITSVNT